jgi:ribose transport system permease protein
MKKISIGFKQIYKSTALRIILMMLVLYIISGIMTPAYFKFSHIMKILVLGCFLGIISIGQTFVIISGGADLSVAYTVTFSACVFAQTIKLTGSGLTGLIAVIAVSLAIGLFKGFGVAVLKIPSMVMTLAMNAILMSVTYLYTGGVLKGESTDFITALAKDSIFGVRYCVIAWLVLGIIAIWILKKTRFGRSIYAVGSNMRVAKLSGINTTSVLMGVYVFSTLMMTIAGIILIGYLGYPNYTMADGYQLISIAAVVIGGTSILGGQGGYLGTMGGVVIIYLIESILITLNIAEAGKEIVNGAIILIILLAYGRGKKQA